MDDKQYITKERKKELEKELEYFTTVRRKEVAEQLDHARSLGDLSENAEYQEARDNQAKLEDRIAEIEHIIRNAEIVKHHKADKVELGTTAVIQKKGSSAKQEFEIVGPEDADLSKGRLSYQSPLGQAVLDNKKGDTFVFESPKGKVEYKVVDIK